jgi:hypothetical protein
LDAAKLDQSVDRVGGQRMEKIKNSVLESTIYNNQKGSFLIKIPISLV